MPFLPNKQDQLTFLPKSLEELVPEKHVCRVIDRFVRLLPRKVIEDRLERRRGRPSHHPRLMLKVLLYAYTQQLYSSRKIAKAIRENVCFMWLAGMERPDFNTVNRFRSVYLRECLDDVFAHLTELLLEEGYITGEDYFVDGTLLEADARKHHVVWKKNTQRYAEAVRSRALEILEEVERVNQEEDERYGERDLEEIGEGSDLTAEKIEELAREIGEELAQKQEELSRKERRRRKSQVRKLEKEAEKLRRYEKQEEILEGRNSYSKTDSDATFMRLKNGELRGAYNLQIGAEGGFILGYSLSQSPNDAASLKGLLEVRKDQGWEQELPKHLVADAGYGSEENYELLKEKKIEAYVKYPSWHREATGKIKKFEKAAFEYDESSDEFICPAGRRLVRIEVKEVERRSGYVTEERQYVGECSGCQWKEKCTRGKGNRTLKHLPRLVKHQEEVRQRLTSEKGIEFRRRRGWEVETPFAMMKKNLGFVRVHLRGLAKATLDVGYLMIGLNLMRLNSVIG